MDRLSPKERMLRALRGEIPDVLPAAPAYLILFLADFERSYYAEQVRRRLRGRRSLHIDHDEDTHLRAEAFLHAYGVFKARPDWLEVRSGPSRAWSERSDIVAVDGILLYEDRLSGKQTPILAPRSLTDVWDLSPELHDAADVDPRLPIVPAEGLLASLDTNPRLIDTLVATAHSIPGDPKQSGPWEEPGRHPATV